MNVVVWGQVKSKNSSLPVAVRISKTRVLKLPKAPAKRSQHANATYRNIVGRNMLRAFGHLVAMCCDMLGVVGSSLKLVKFEPTTSNMSRHGGQTHATCCAQQCCDMLCWHVAIVWPGLNDNFFHPPTNWSRANVAWLCACTHFAQKIYVTNG